MSVLHPSSAGRHGVTWPVRRDPAGVRGPTPQQVRGRHWRRTSRGLYVPAEVDATSPQQRIAEAFSTLAGYGGVTGWAALCWMGARWFGGTSGDGTTLPVTLATGVHCMRAQPGIAVSEERLSPRDLVEDDGLTRTSAVRSVCYLMRYAPNLRRAVGAFEMAAYDDLVSVSEVVAYAHAHPGWTGIPQCRDALLLCEENSWSPMETEMRLIWMIDAGLPRPLCNVPVFDRDGRHIGTPDLLDPEAGLVGEYDGALHLVGEQRVRDVRREEAFRAVGLECFRMMASDRRSRHAMAERMIAARRRARWLSESHRAWTLEPPAWWVPTTTVTERRALDESARERWLRLRRAS